MPRPCSICTRGDRAAIERAIVEGTPNRRIAAQFGLVETSLRRHRADHLPRLLAEIEAARPAPAQPSQPATLSPPAPAAPESRASEYGALLADVGDAVAQRAARNVDVYQELLTRLDRMAMLENALHEWLLDPDDPSRYTIDPRANEIQVVYDDHLDTTPSGRPRRKRAQLSHLLAHVATMTGGELRPLSGETKVADPRKLLIDAQRSVYAQMQLRVEMAQIIHNAQALERFQTRVLEAIGEADPATRVRIETALAGRLQEAALPA